MEQATKAEERSLLLRLRREISAAEWQRWSSRIVDLLVHAKQYQQAKCLMAYLSMDDEICLDALIAHGGAAGKTVLVPRMSAERGWMEAVTFPGWGHCPRGRFGIRSPQGEHAQVVPPENIDLILVPGLAFDLHGWRLGLGGGYYDRFLPRATQAKRIGICPSRFLLPHVPHEPHDQKVHGVVTDQGISRVRQ